MTESIVKASSILLYGRVVEDLQIRTPSGSAAKRAARTASSEPLGANHLLAEQLAAEGSCFARIYAFAYEGEYFDLARPTLYLVHGPGEPIAEPVALDQSGVAVPPTRYASDLRVWSFYDKEDMSIRLEIDTGRLEQILLDMEIGAGPAAYSGQLARAGQLARSGQLARAGQLARSGQLARIRGNRSGDE